MSNKNFDVIIIGGSYAGLSAAMALGRSLRKVLIIDSGQPCNIQTPHSHNFLTQDGSTPAEISSLALKQVMKYDTVTFHKGKAVNVIKGEKQFEIGTEAGETFVSSKLILATGIKDTMPDIRGFAQCWGISVLHCPYCHGYEVSGETLGVLANGDMGYEMSKLISNWTKDLTLFTNGKSTLTSEQTNKLKGKNIKIVEEEILEIEHTKGNMDKLLFKGGATYKIKAIFAKIPFTHTEISLQLGCALSEHGFIQVDEFQKTSIPGVYAAGDNTNMFRAVSMAVAAGNKAGAVLNKELIEETF